jgi:hypothetical protein
VKESEFGELKFPRFGGQAGRRPIRKDCKHAEKTRELRQRILSRIH